MPLSNDNPRSAQQRVMGMFMDTIGTFETLLTTRPRFTAIAPRQFGLIVGAASA